MGAECVLITCEHGGNRIPARYRPLFRGWRARLASHRGFDPGALLLARDLARAFKAPVVSSSVSRLLVDLNRSAGHPQFFSEATRHAPPALRAAIVREHYLLHRSQVERLARHAVGHGRRVIHIASHSFAPQIDGRVRRADVGLLYDPGRPGEAALCARWKAALAGLAPEFRVRRNYPYAGKGDGLTRHLRQVFPPRAYVGVELEVNQAIVLGASRRWATLRRALVATLRSALAA